MECNNLPTAYGDRRASLKGFVRCALERPCRGLTFIGKTVSGGATFAVAEYDSRLGASFRNFGKRGLSVQAVRGEFRKHGVIVTPVKGKGGKHAYAASHDIVPLEPGDSFYGWEAEDVR